MKESEFHAWLKATVPKAKGVSLGIGDDAAVLEAVGPMAVASDILVEGIHYKKEEVSPREIGAKAVNRNFSDMAAMGLAPHWIVVSAAIPEETPEGFVHEVVQGILQAAKAFDVGILGGDTSRTIGSLVIDVTVLGKIEKLSPIPRSGARPGDRIWVTGDLGGSAGGKHLRFVPRVKEGLFLNQGYGPSAMIDISDGLAMDLYRILDASHVGACLDSEKIPLAEAAHKQASSSGKPPLDHALSDGEDFELLFTLSPKKSLDLAKDPKRFFKATEIGEIKADPKERVLKIKDQYPILQREGFDHRI